MLILFVIVLISCNQQTNDKNLPKSWDTSGKKVFIFDPKLFIWAVYNEQGYKIKTGSASGGKNYCPDLKKPCRTVIGTYQVFSRKGADCKSSQFPIKKGREKNAGGAKMPYCMHFHNGYAIHGATKVTRQHVSHGCIHVSIQDAKWLNEKFVDEDTTVIVRPYA